MLGFRRCFVAGHHNRDGFDCSGCSTRTRLLDTEDRSIAVSLSFFSPIKGRNSRFEFFFRGCPPAHDLAPCFEGGPSWIRSMIPSSRSHCMASSVLTARCRSETPTVSIVLVINLDRHSPVSRRASDIHLHI